MFHIEPAAYTGGTAAFGHNGNVGTSNGSGNLMVALEGLRKRWPKNLPLQPLPSVAWAKQEPTWKGANPQVIESALKRAKTRPSGNWFVFAASRDIGTDKPFGRHIGGTELVAWRDENRGIHIAPGACPHLGAPLDKAKIECDTLICLWHGMPLGPKGRPGWRPFPAFDDGIRSAAIVFMHGYRYPAHENLVAGIAGQIGFTQVSVSNRVSPMMKLVSRGDTTVVDAYLSPILRRYVDRVAADLEAGGDTMEGPPRLQFMQSNGGLTDAKLFQGKDSILSGPAGGVVGMAVNLAVFLIVSKATGTTAEEKARVDAMFEVGKRPTRTAPVDLSFEDQIEELATNPAPEKI